MTPETQWLKTINAKYFPWSWGSAGWWSICTSLTRLGCHMHMAETHLGGWGLSPPQGAGLGSFTYQRRATPMDKHFSRFSCIMNAAISLAKASHKATPNPSGGKTGSTFWWPGLQIIVVILFLFPQLGVLLVEGPELPALIEIFPFF